MVGTSLMQSHPSSMRFRQRWVPRQSKGSTTIQGVSAIPLSHLLELDNSIFWNSHVFREKQLISISLPFLLHVATVRSGAPSAVLLSLAGASLDFGCGIVQIVWNTWTGAFLASIAFVIQNFVPVAGGCAGIIGAIGCGGLTDKDQDGGGKMFALCVILFSPVLAVVLLVILIVIWFLLLAVSFVVVLLFAVVVAVIVVPITILVALLILFVIFLVIAGLVLLAFTACWLIYLGVLLALAQLGLGAVDGSLRASKASSGSCGKCTGQGIVSKWVVPWLVMGELGFMFVPLDRIVLPVTF